MSYIQGDAEIPDQDTPTAFETASAAAQADYPQEAERYRYCTEALVRGKNLPDQTEIRDRLRQEGDSLIVMGAADDIRAAGGET